MDRRMLAALITLATASGALPALAAQVQGPATQGAKMKLSQDAILRSVYGVALSPNGKAVGTKAFTQIGYNPQEASQMADVSIAVAGKAGSFEKFQAVIKGSTPAGVSLTPREMAMLTSLASKAGGSQKRAGATWEGTSGDTWEGSAIARPGGAKPVLSSSAVNGPSRVVGPATAAPVRPGLKVGDH